MRFTSKVVFIALLSVFAATAQKPVGISRFIDPWVNGWSLQTNVSGDNEMATAWAANSLLRLFANPTGLPVLFPVNDMSLNGCGGNLGIVQISKLAGIGVTATSGNTLMTPVNCMSSYASATSPNGTWNDGLSWKGAVMAFRNNRLLAYFYRQANAGNTFTDSSLVMSPDAGQTWIDYGRYNGYTVTAASCTGTTVTLTAANALSAGQLIYVHDIGVVYNGEQTIATASGSQLTYAVSTCTGATGSTGYFGILSADGSAPLGPLDAGYNMMWPASDGRQMVVPSPISYGQDGNYPTGIDSACDPTVYVCGLSWDARGSEKIYLWRVPLGQEMTKASYQWYTCSGYSAYWAVADTVCDGNNSANWTSTMTSATPLLYTAGSAVYPAQLFNMKYLPSHRAYITAHSSGASLYRESFSWAPRPWGPFYPLNSSECSERDANYPYGCVAFFSLMDYGENIISVDPPKTQIRIAAKSDLDGGNGQGSPGFWTVEAGSGRVPFTGAARRADYMGVSGQMGVGHRFVSGSEAGAISRRGAGYSIDWWTDFWDHGGNTGGTNRPWFRDVISGGAKYFRPVFTDGTDGFTFGKGLSLDSSGPKIVYSGYSDRIQSNFTDSTTFPGNSSWTFITTFKVTNGTAGAGGGVYSSNQTGNLLYAGGAHTETVSLEIGFGRNWSGTHTGDGNIFVAWGDTASSTSPTFFHTTSDLIVPNVWYFLAVTAKANASGFPTLTVYIASGGALTEYGGGDLSASADGSSSNGLAKACGTHCSTTPNVNSGALVRLGSDEWSPINGIVGDTGAYSGVVPSHVIREIYRTLRTDWARVGRGTL